MFIKPITFTDYNGEKRTQEYYFNLTRSEIWALESTRKGGLSAYLKIIADKREYGPLVEAFETIILSSYGEKSLDGSRFVKTDEMREEFKQSAAYEALFDELISNTDSLTEFVNAIMPTEKQ